MLAHGEPVTAVHLPPAAPGGGPRTSRPATGPRTPSPQGRWPRCWTSTGTWSATCRLAYGAVAHRPWRAYRAEEELRGRPFSPDLAARAADAELAEARPLRHNGFKLPLTRAITVRALTELASS